MLVKPENDPRKRVTLLLCSLAAGIINGLFGMGGGIIIYFTLSHLYAQSGKFDTKDTFAMTVISVLIMSVSSVFMYSSSGAFSAGDVLPYILPAAIGGIVGAFALSHLKASLLKRIFAAIMIYGGISLILRK